jgi:hypothetical protein
MESDSNDDEDGYDDDDMRTPYTRDIRDNALAP